MIGFVLGVVITLVVLSAISRDTVDKILDKIAFWKK